MPSGPPKPKKYDPIKTMKRISRDSDPHKGSRRGGFHGPPKGKKGYTRKEKHSGQTDDGSSEALTPEDSTYRDMMYPLANVLSWDTPAEGRPCGEGEDPKRGKCNPNVAPVEKPGRYDIGPDEYRKDDAEWERQIDKGREDEQRHQRDWEQQQRQSKPFSKDPISHPGDVGVDPAFRGRGGPMTGPQIDDQTELDDSLDPNLGGEFSSQRLVDTAKRMGLHDEQSDALMRQWQQENPGSDDLHTIEVMKDHYEKKIMKPGYEGGGTPVKDTPGFPPTKDRHLPAYQPKKGAPEGASMSQIESKLDWSTHKSETFDDTGENGLHPAWGLKSIIDRGVKPHEHPRGDKRIGEADHQTTKRDISSKSFKAYSMVHAFEWVIGDLPFEGAAPPFGSKDDDDETEESDE